MKIRAQMFTEVEVSPLYVLESILEILQPVFHWVEEDGEDNYYLMHNNHGLDTISKVLTKDEYDLIKKLEEAIQLWKKVKV